jgi:hypothetical protein
MLSAAAFLTAPGIPTHTLPSRKLFGINTYVTAHKCGKQSTYTIAKSFRIRTYEIQGEGVNSLVAHFELPSSLLAIHRSLP